MKKIFALALCAVMMLSVLAGCGGKEETPAQTKAKEETQAPTEGKTQAHTEAKKETDASSEEGTGCLRKPECIKERFCGADRSGEGRKSGSGEDHYGCVQF